MFPRYKIQNLQISSRLRSKSKAAGIHNSQRLGLGTDFSQYRSYQPGDDLRQLDWKLLARSGRYYVRQAEVDRQLRVGILVDSSASMQYVEAQQSKFEIAKGLAVAIAQVCQQQGDQFGLLLFNDEKQESLMPGLGNRQMRRLQQMLIAAAAKGKVRTRIKDDFANYPFSSIDLFFVISDFYEDNAQLTGLCNELTELGKELYGVQLIGEQEKEFAFDTWLEIEDLESGQSIEIDAEASGQQYRRRFQEYCSSVAQQIDGPLSLYRLIKMQDPIEHSLASILRH